MMKIAIAGIALGLLAAPAAHAQKSARRATPVPPTKGLMLGAHTVLASGITIDGPTFQAPMKTNTGEGAGIQIAYGFTPQIMAFASVDVARQGTEIANIGGSMGLAHLELGGRLSFPRPGKRLVPYVSGLVGKQGLAAHSDGGGMSVTMRLSGTEIGAGGGFLYAFSPALSMEAGVIASRGKFGRMVMSGDVQRETDVEVNTSTNFRLKVGFQWHP